MTPAASTPDELLQRARDQAEPDLGEAGRVLARLRARVPATLAAGEPPRELSGGGHWLTPALRRTLLGTAGVVLFGVGFLLGRLSTQPSAMAPPPDDSSSVAPNAASAAPASPNDAVADAPSTPSVPTTPSPSSRAVSAAASLSEPPARAPARALRPRAPSREHVANEPLKEALRRLRLAQRALYEHDAGRALAVLDDLDRRITLAVLGEERQMTRILALCGAGELADARALAQRWTAEYPQSIYLARLQNSCIDADGVTPSETGVPLNPR